MKPLFTNCTFDHIQPWIFICITFKESSSTFTVSVKLCFDFFVVSVDCGNGISLPCSKPLADGFLILILHTFFFPVKNQIENPLQTPQEKHRNLPHLIVAVHFVYKSRIAYLEKTLFCISALQHSWMCNRMTRSRISKIPRQHILLPWQQLTNDLHHVEFEKTPHFVSKIVSKFLTLCLLDQGHLEIAIK